MRTRVNRNHGGYREGAGRKSGWVHGPTKAIKVPEPLAARILSIARALDKGDTVVVEDGLKFQADGPKPQLDSVTESRDLRGEVLSVVAAYRERQRDTRNWVEAVRLLDELEALMGQ